MRTRYSREPLAGNYLWFINIFCSSDGDCVRQQVWEGLRNSLRGIQMRNKSLNLYNSGGVPSFENTFNKQISYKTSSDKVINRKIPHCIEKSWRKLKGKVNNFPAGKMRACVRDCLWEAVCSYLRDSCWGEQLEYLSSLTCNVMFSSKNVRPPMRQRTRRNVKQARL